MEVDVSDDFPFQLGDFLGSMLNNVNFPGCIFCNIYLRINWISLVTTVISCCANDDTTAPSETSKKHRKHYTSISPEHYNIKAQTSQSLKSITNIFCAGKNTRPYSWPPKTINKHDSSLNCQWLCRWCADFVRQDPNCHLNQSLGGWRFRSLYCYQVAMKLIH